VNANADVETEVVDRVAYGAGAADRSRWSVEARGEEAVASGVDLVAAVSGELSTNPSIVFTQQLWPAWA
jgi:hypothetical protein